MYMYSNNAPSNHSQLVPGDCQVCFHCQTLLWGNVNRHSHITEQLVPVIFIQGQLLSPKNETSPAISSFTFMTSCDRLCGVCVLTSPASLERVTRTRVSGYKVMCMSVVYCIIYYYAFTCKLTVPLVGISTTFSGLVESMLRLSPNGSCREYKQQLDSAVLLAGTKFPCTQGTEDIRWLRWFESPKDVQ